MPAQSKTPFHPKTAPLGPDLDQRISRTLIELRRTLSTMRDRTARDRTQADVEALAIVELSLDLVRSSLCLYLRNGASLPSAMLGMAYLMEDAEILAGLCSIPRTADCPLLAADDESKT